MWMEEVEERRKVGLTHMCTEGLPVTSILWVKRRVRKTLQSACCR